MGKVVEQIMSEFETRKVKSLKDVKKVLFDIEDDVNENAINDLLGTLIDYIEKERPDTLDLYIMLKRMRDGKDDTME